MRFHDLRHTHGSLLIAEGVPVNVVSERLGHTHIAHTLQTYQHVLPGIQADAARTAQRLADPRRTPKKQIAKRAQKPTVESPGNSRRKAA